MEKTGWNKKNMLDFLNIICYNHTSLEIEEI